MSLHHEIKKALDTIMKKGKKHHLKEFKDDQCLITTKVSLGTEQYIAHELTRIVNRDIGQYSNDLALWITRKAEDQNYDMHQGIVINIQLILNERTITHTNAHFRAMKHKDSFTLARISPESSIDDTDPNSPILSKDTKTNEASSASISASATTSGSFFTKLNPFKSSPTASAAPTPIATATSSKAPLKRQQNFYGAIPTPVPTISITTAPNPDAELLDELLHTRL